MNAVERLRRDHVILHSKLDVLESALSMGSRTWFVLREVCYTLSRQLRDHIKREDDLVERCRRAMILLPDGDPALAGSGSQRNPASGLPAGGGMNPKVLAAVAIEHKDESAHLRTINYLFISEPGHSLDRIRPALLEVITGLRRHMAEEERELFPMLERTLPQLEPEPLFSGAAPAIDETMTVNRIVRAFPRTRPVFDRLFISLPAEGCTCLDEVAWRHGMESCELLQRLEQAIEVSGASSAAAGKEAARTPECARAQ
jgi:hypothetical protein